jgi:hypothetical protein
MTIKNLTRVTLYSDIADIADIAHFRIKVS